MHSIALRDATCADQRIFSFAAPFHRSDVLAVFHELRPDGTFPADDKDTGRDLSVIPSEDAEELLRKYYGKGFVSLRECIGATIDGV